MKKNEMSVFISRPNWIDPKMKRGLDNFLGFLRDVGLNPRTLGVTDLPARVPLDEVIEILDECSGAIILGYPQMKVSSGAKKNRKITKSFLLPTEWNHIEAALAYARGFPIMIIHHKGISGGVFERGVTNTYIHNIDLSKDNWFENGKLNEFVLSWKERCKIGKANRPVGKKEVEVFKDSTVERIKNLLVLLEISPDEMALEIGERSQEYLLKVLGGQSPEFSFLKKIADRFYVNETWLKTGKGNPFQTIQGYKFDLKEVEKFIQKSCEDIDFYFFMANESDVKYASCAIKIDDYKYIVFDHHIHLSSHVGGGGSADIHNFYRFIKELYDRTTFSSLYVTEEEFHDLIAGDMSYKLIDKLHRHYHPWAVDFVDIDFKIFSREQHVKDHGEEYAKALEIARRIEYRERK